MLRVWLPMTKDLKNQGIADIEVTNHGATLNDNGKIGKCYSFNTGNYLTIDPTPMKIFNEVSIAFWVKIISWNTNYATIIVAKNGSGYSWNNEIFAVQRYSNTSRLCFNIADGSSSLSGNIGTNDLDLNTWYHVVCTYETGYCKIYQNGELVSTKTTNIVPNFGTIANCFIGKATEGAYQFNGYLNDMRVYDHALSPMEVKHLSQGLVLHYPLDNNGIGNKNISSKYVSCGSGNPDNTNNGGRTKYYGDYGIIIPAVEAADTYFTIWTTELLENGQTYTLSANVSGLINGTRYVFPLFSQGNSSMGQIIFDHNGLNSLTFVMTYTGSDISTKILNGKTYYRLFMDDNGRDIASGQGEITINNIKLEKGSIATPWCPNPSDALYTALGYDDGIEYDTSGYGNNGTKVGTLSYSTDSPRYLASTVFDGTNNISFPIALGGQKDCTIAFWAKPNTTNASGCMLSLERNTYWQFTFYGSHLEIRDSSTGYTGTRKSYSIGTLVANTWTHICVTYSSGILKIYRDGEMLSTNTVGGTNLCNELNEGRVGSAMQSGYFWSGNISDVRVYASCLSDSEIQKLYTVSASIDSNGNAYSAAYVEG